MPRFNSNSGATQHHSITKPVERQSSQTPSWLVPGHVRSKAYCTGFMNGLYDEFDDTPVLAVLQPVYSPTMLDLQQKLNGTDHATIAAQFMKGLYDGLRERRRLCGNPGDLGALVAFKASLSALGQSSVLL